MPVILVSEGSAFRTIRSAALRTAGVTGKEVEQHVSEQCGIEAGGAATLGWAPSPVLLLRKLPGGSLNAD